MKLLGKLLAAGALAAALTGAASASWVGVGTVDVPLLHFRAEADVTSQSLDILEKGARVLLLEDLGEWYRVDVAGQEGYMMASYLTAETEMEGELGYGEVTTAGSSLNLRAGAGTDTAVLASIPRGTLLALSGFSEGWFRVTYAGKTGYVSGDYITPTHRVPNPPSDLGERIVEEAARYLGIPYRYGGKGPKSFDCSGFTAYVFRQVGVELTATSSTQWLQTPGQRISSISELQPGDLFFLCDPRYSKGHVTSHVGIYVGDGRFIHANSSKGISYSNIYYSDYAPYFIGGIRVGS